MNNQEILEGNKLIAEFTGFEIKNNKIIYDPSDVPPDELLIGWCLCNLKYHCAWNWLMPVINKIESLDLRKNGYDFSKVKFMGDYVEIFCYANYRGTSYYWKYWMDIAGTFHKHPNQCESKILAAFSAVVEFIKWYNKNKEL